MSQPNGSWIPPLNHPETLNMELMSFYIALERKRELEGQVLEVMPGVAYITSMYIH